MAKIVYLSVDNGEVVGVFSTRQKAKKYGRDVYSLEIDKVEVESEEEEEDDDDDDEEYEEEDESD